MGKALILQHYSGATGHQRRCLEAFCLNVSCRHFYISMLNHAFCMMGGFYDLMCFPGPSPWKNTSSSTLRSPNISGVLLSPHDSGPNMCMYVLLQVLQGADTKMKCTENLSEEISVKENEEEVRKGGKRCQSMIYV